MRIKEITYRYIVYILAGLLYCGCVNMEEDLAQTETGPKALNMVVSLRIDQNALIGGLRATTGTDFEGTPDESQIKTLTLFVTKIGTGTEVVEGSQTINNPNISQILKFIIPGEAGRKKFYLAANMSPEQIAAFTGDKSEYNLPTSDLSTVYANTDDLMDINHSDKGQGSNILMTARITHDGGQPEFMVKAGEIFIDTPVKLERVVSKVLLTCSMIDDEYIQVKADQGWTKLADVRYMGNLFNRKLYFFPQVDGTSGLKDSNYEISHFIEESTGKIKDKDVYNVNFLAHDAFQQIAKLKADDCKSYYKAVKYDASRLNSAESNRYYEGLYYPENRVKKDIVFNTIATYTTEETFAIVSRQLTTHLLVAVKFVPKTVWIDDAGALKEVTTSTATEMLNNHLKETTEVLSGQTHTYPVGTYWYYDSKYYTLGGIQRFLELNTSISRSEIERFDSGWGYYFTFIDGKANNGVIDYQSETSWGLTRNHYYILNVTQLTPPGSSVPGNRLMKIPTERVEWIDKGNSDVNVIP